MKIMPWSSIEFPEYPDIVIEGPEGPGSPTGMLFVFDTLEDAQEFADDPTTLIQKIDIYNEEFDA